MQKQHVADRDQKLLDCRQSLAILTDRYSALKAASSKTISLLSNRILALQDESDQASRGHAAELETVTRRLESEWQTQFLQAAIDHQQEIRSAQAQASAMSARIDSLQVDLQTAARDKAAAARDKAALEYALAEANHELQQRVSYATPCARAAFLRQAFFCNILNMYEKLLGNVGQVLMKGSSPR